MTDTTYCTTFPAVGKRGFIRTTEGAFVRDLLVAFDGSNLIEGANVWREAAMNTQYTLVDYLHRATHAISCHAHVVSITR